MPRNHPQPSFGHTIEPGEDHFWPHFFPGYRIDNSTFWVEYYFDKLSNNDVDRERRYSALLTGVLYPEATVVDLGAGIGFMSKELARRGLSVIPIDLSPRMLDILVNYTRDVDHLLPTNADAVRLPIASESIDAMVAISLVEHFTIIEATESLLPEIWRVLRINGYLFVHVPIKTHKTRFIRFWKMHISRTLPDWAIDDHADMTHRIWLSWQEYVSLIQARGFLLERYGFQLRHSNAGSLVRLLDQIVTGVLNRSLNGHAVFQPLRTRKSFVLSAKQCLATSCFCLFRKVMD